jgi:hypothetical protein
VDSKGGSGPALRDAVRDERLGQIRRNAGRPARPLAVIISRSGQIPFDIPMRGRALLTISPVLAGADELRITSGAPLETPLALTLV